MESLPVPSLDWRTVESSDYREYVENLRRIGCPEQTIREIVEQDLRQNFLIQRWQALRDTGRTDFWKPDFVLGSTLASNALEQIAALSSGFNDAYQELLGVPPSDSHSLRDLESIDRELVARFGKLDPEKYTRIKSVLQKARTEMNWRPPGEQRSAINEEAERAVETLLTAEELELYRLKTSSTARQLRQGLGGFEPSQEEFTTAFRAIELRRGPADRPISSDEARSALESVLSRERRQEFLRSR